MSCGAFDAVRDELPNARISIPAPVVRFHATSLRFSVSIASDGMFKLKGLKALIIKHNVSSRL